MGVFIGYLPSEKGAINGIFLQTESLYQVFTIESLSYPGGIMRESEENGAGNRRENPQLASIFYEIYSFSLTYDRESSLGKL